MEIDPMNYRGLPIHEQYYNIAPTSLHPILTLGSAFRSGPSSAFRRPPQAAAQDHSAGPLLNL